MQSTVRGPSVFDSTPFRQAVQRHVAYSLGLTLDQLTPREAFHAVALAVRDQMVERELQTEQRNQAADAKRLYYLSLEFLIGRSLANNLANLGLLDACRDALRELGLSWEDVEESEVDAA